MTLVSGHVIIIGIIAACATILGMAHIATGSDSTNIFIGCIASFSVHGVTATVRRGPEG